MKLLTCSLFLLFAHPLAFAQQPEPSTSAPGAPLHVVSANNQDTQWQPTDAERKRVVQDTTAYFDAKDARRYADAYAFFSASQKEVVTFDRWKADMEAFYAKAGTAQGRTIRKVTWYKNPLNAQPGIYAAVDFSGQFSELSLHCGFLAWRQQMDGSFGLVREEQNSIPKAEMSTLTPETLRKIRAEFRC